MATHLGEAPHGLLPDACKVLQRQAMWPEGLHYLHDIIMYTFLKALVHDPACRNPLS